MTVDMMTHATPDIRLKECCSFVRGLTYKKEDEVDFSSNVVLRANNIDLATSSLDFAELKYLKESFVIPNDKIIKKGDILICTASGSKAHLGKVAVIDDDYGYAFGGFMGVLKPFPCIDSRYLFTLLCSGEFKNYVNCIVNGANINNLKFSNIENFSIPLPPLEEQKRIVGILDAAFEKIDAVKRNAEQNLANAKELFQRTLDEEMTPKDGWEIATMRDLCRIDAVLVDPREEKYRTLLHVGGGNIVSETGKLINLRTAQDEKLVSGKFVFNATDVLYNKIRPYLKKIARPNFSGLCSADMYPLVPQIKCHRNFLFYLLLSNEFTTYAVKNSERAGMPKLNRAALFSFTTKIPPVKQQISISKKLDFCSKACDTLQSQCIKISDLCAELKQQILAKAFRGEL